MTHRLLDMNNMDVFEDCFYNMQNNRAFCRMILLYISFFASISGYHK